MSSGLPCVIADGGGSKSFVEHGQNGFLCDPFDERDYLTHIKSLMSDAALRSEIITNSLAYTVGYDWGTLIEDYYSQVKLLTKKHIRNSVV